MGRSAPRQLEIRVERDPDAPSARLTLSVSIDRAEAYPIRFGLQGRALVNIPPATTPGLRVELVWGGVEPPPRIEALILDKRPTPWALVLLAFFSTSGAVLLFVRRCCTARSKSLTSLCRLQNHPAQYVSGIPSAAILLSISHPIRCSTRCLANVRARISGPMIAL